MDNKIVWNAASRSGIVLGVVSALYFTANILMASLPSGVLLSVGGGALWVVKFAACLVLFKTGMARFASANPDASNRDTFRWGLATALLSALVYSAWTLAWSTLIQPDMYIDQISQVTEAYASAGMFTSAQLDAFEEMAPRFPTIMFFFNLVYCFLFGLVLSAIYSRNIPSRNPFGAPLGPDDQDQDDDI